MGSEHIPDQVKKAPTDAIRAVFAGIGRMFLAVERAPDPAGHASQETTGPTVARRRAPAGRHERPRGAPRPETDARWRSLDKTGNVRLLSAEDLAIDYPEFAARSQASPIDAVLTDAVAPEASVPDLSQGEPADADFVPDDSPRDGSQRHEAEAVLPIADYDIASLASIRARLRGLDTDQLRVLLEYERAHAERPDVLGMFERRISKLESGG